MMDDTGADAFATFRDLVYDDFSLATWLRVPIEREAYLARVVELGAEKGLKFGVDDVRAALRNGENTWLMHDAEDVA